MSPGIGCQELDRSLNVRIRLPFSEVLLYRNSDFIEVCGVAILELEIPLGSYD